MLFLDLLDCGGQGLVGFGVAVGCGHRAEVFGHLRQGAQLGVTAIGSIAVHQGALLRRPVLIIGAGIVTVVDSFIAVHPEIAAAVGDEDHVLLGIRGEQFRIFQILDAGLDTGLHVGAHINFRQGFHQLLYGKAAAIAHQRHGNGNLSRLTEHSNARIDIVHFASQILFNGIHHILEPLCAVDNAMQAAGAVQHELHRHGTLVRGGGDRQIQCRFAAFQFRSILVQNNTLLGIGDLSRIRALIFGCSRRKRGRHHAKQHDGSQNPR